MAANRSKPRGNLERGLRRARATYRRHQGEPTRNKEHRDYMNDAMACGYQAGHRMLQGYLAERWLHNGDYESTAVWLKIVHELANPGLPPAQVLLKAYDDMPTVQCPDFLGPA